MKKVLITAIVCVLISATGCSSLVSTPRVARIQIQGMDNRLDEHFIVLDVRPNNDPVGIPISDRSAINLDLQWLLGPSAQMYSTEIDEDAPQEWSEAPWITWTCKF